MTLRLKLSKIFNLSKKTHCYYKFFEIVFSIKNYIFNLSLLLSKSNLLFYAQVPNRLYDDNSESLTERKWLRSAPGINNIKKIFF